MAEKFVLPPEWVKALRAKPECRMTRLTCGDALADAGYKDRAEYIRVSNGPDESTCLFRGAKKGLSRLEKQRCDHCKCESLLWMYSLGFVFHDWCPRDDGESLRSHLKFRNGFCYEVTTTLRDWLNEGVSIVRSHPVVNLELLDARPQKVNGCYRWVESDSPAMLGKNVPPVIYGLLNCENTAKRTSEKIYVSYWDAIRDLVQAMLKYAITKAGLT